MNYNYFCPMCKGQLRIEDNLVFAAKSRDNKKGLIFLNPELGNYTTKKHPLFDIHEGEEYNFYCPICQAKLNSKENNKLVKINMTDEDNNEFEIYFSGIAGEKCTYKMRDKEMEQLGPDAEKYHKYFDLAEEYKKYL